MKRPSLDVDPFGNPVVDPTKNVETALASDRARADDLREAEAKLRDYQARIVEERTNIAVAHLKEVSDLHVNYAEKLNQEKTISAEAKAKVIESQLTIDRERANLSAQLLAKTVNENAEKLRAELDMFKKENNDRLLRIEGSISTSTGKSAGVSSTSEWTIRIILFLIAIAGFAWGFIK